MKKLWLLVLCIGLLSGCAPRETFETVGDWYYEPVVSHGIVTLQLPQDAVASTMSVEAGSVYLCDGYTVSLLTLAGGDLPRTVREVSGFPAERVELIATQRGGVDRYDFVWACAGEGGDQLGRAAILDDGTYHYVLTVLGEANICGSNQSIETLFDTFTLNYGS